MQKSHNETKQWICRSPHNQFKVEVKLLNGKVSFKVYKDGELVLYDSELGLITSRENYYEDIEFSEWNMKEINDLFPMFTGKRKEYKDHCNCYSFKMQNASKTPYEIIFRVYDHGVAYRYAFDCDQQCTVEDEKGNFVIPKTVKDVFAMKYINYYEGFYRQRRKVSGNLSMPLLYRLASDTHVLIAQGELRSTYNGRMLKGDGNRTLRIVSIHKRSEEGKKAFKELENPVINGEFKSPWRIIIAGNLEDVFQTEIIEAVNPPLALENTSFIKPGSSGWSWWNGDPTDDPQVYKEYIDYCNEMVFPYMLFDEGWQKIPEKQLLDVMAYAKEKAVGVFLWANQNDFRTDEQFDTLLKWKHMGAAGVKIDFFDSEEQRRLEIYDKIIEKTIEAELLVNFHGCNAPSGLRRTYPHLIAWEGVRGAEYTKMFFGAPPTAKHNCTIPFTRNIVGPMDFTPVTYSNTGKKYTMAQSTALPIIFESGTTTIADKPKNILGSKAVDFLYGLPCVWDDSKLLEGVVGEYVTIARKSKDTWYIGAICDQSRTASISLDFLEKGEYSAHIIEDHDKKELRATTVTVHNKSNIHLPLLKHGGVAIKITRILD